MAGGVMAYSTLASQSDTPTAGPDHTYFEQIAANETALLTAVGARISSASAATFTAGTTTKLALGTVSFDLLSGAFTGTADRITIPSGWDGLYLVCAGASVEQATNGAASGQLKVRKNNTSDVFESFDTWTLGISNINLSTTAWFPVELAAADFLEVFYVNGELLDATLREDFGVSLTAIWLYA